MPVEPRRAAAVAATALLVSLTAVAAYAIGELSGGGDSTRFGNVQPIDDNHPSRMPYVHHSYSPSGGYQHTPGELSPYQHSYGPAPQSPSPYGTPHTTHSDGW